MRFELFGFPVFVQPTVLWVAGIYALFGIERKEPLPIVIAGVVVIFWSILVHELGHAMAARRLVGGSIGITLHGFGGLTVHDRADRPWKQLLIVLAGPAAGFVVVLVAVTLQLVLPLGELGKDVVSDLFAVNLFWSVFNLLPFFPLDGGQALAALLRWFVPTLAWPVTIWVGILGGGALGILALWLSAEGFGTSLFLLFIAGMIIAQNIQVRRRWLDARGLEQR